MKNRRVYFISSNTSSAELAALQYITREVVDVPGSAMKVISSLEPLKNRINNNIRHLIGVDVFATKAREKSLVDPITMAYKNSLEELDPDWNKDQLKDYISGLEITLPHAVRFFIREVNDEATVNLAIEENYPILRIEDSAYTCDDHHLCNESFSKIIGSHNYVKVQVKSLHAAEDLDDLNAKTESKIKKAFSELNELDIGLQVN